MIKKYIEIISYIVILYQYLSKNACGEYKLSRSEYETSCSILYPAELAVAKTAKMTKGEIVSNLLFGALEFSFFITLFF